VIRTCARLGIESVLAASDADLDSLPARLADRVVALGPAPSSGSYLDPAAVVRAAQVVGADAVHPGYGFLSENPSLALACEAAGIIFVGPSVESLHAVGRQADRPLARTHRRAPGGPGAGGGGSCGRAGRRRGGRLPAAGEGRGGRWRPRHEAVNSADELAHTLDLAISEAAAAFGDPRVYLERYVTSGRHVEVQVLGDGIPRGGARRP
jgi:acetyl-CoA carboxylase biotin carboxylase subunit